MDWGSFILGAFVASIPAAVFARRYDMAHKATVKIRANYKNGYDEGWRDRTKSYENDQADKQMKMSWFTNLPADVQERVRKELRKKAAHS